MSSTAENVTKGSCICGALSYEYTGDPAMTVRMMYTMLLPNPYPLTLIGAFPLSPFHLVTFESIQKFLDPISSSY